jgi:plastocyanin
MDTDNQQFSPNPEAELAVKKVSDKKEKGFRTLHGSGLSWLLIVFVLVLLAFSVSIFKEPLPDQGIAGQGNIGASLEPTPLSQPRVYTVSYRNGVFSPTNLRIRAGDTVRFKNEGLFPIRIIADDLVGFDSIGDVPQGSFFAFTFAAKGIFSYYNYKSSDETATVIVR